MTSRCAARNPRARAAPRGESSRPTTTTTRRLVTSWLGRHRGRGTKCALAGALWRRELSAATTSAMATSSISALDERLRALASRTRVDAGARPDQGALFDLLARARRGDARVGSEGGEGTPAIPRGVAPPGRVRRMGRTRRAQIRGRRPRRPLRRRCERPARTSAIVSRTARPSSSFVRASPRRSVDPRFRPARPPRVHLTSTSRRLTFVSLSPRPPSPPPPPPPPPLVSQATPWRWLVP